MDMVDYRDEYGGLNRSTWWTTQMDMVDYTYGHGEFTDGYGGLHIWSW
jgi:hypothetical protein